MAWFIAAIIAGLIAGIAYNLRLLTGAAAVTAFCIGCLAYGFGQLTFSVPLVFFFVSSSLLSRIQNDHKAGAVLCVAKPGARDSVQVLANGGVPVILLLLWTYSQEPLFCLLYVTALAAATADTWATELGALSSGVPRLIWGFNKVPAGTSGGVTTLGTFAALSGASIVIALGALFLFLEHGYRLPGTVLLVMLGASLFGQLLDSFLGCLVQVKYRCSACGSTTERKEHCPDRPVERTAGIVAVNNDTVNFLSVLASVAAAGFCIRLNW